MVILLLNLIFIKTCRNVNNQVAKQKNNILTNVTNIGNFAIVQIKDVVYVLVLKEIQHFVTNNVFWTKVKIQQQNKELNKKY